MGFSEKMDRPLCAASVISDSCVGVGVDIIIPSRGGGVSVHDDDDDVCLSIASVSD